MKKEENKITGDRIDLVAMNYFLYGCADPDYPNVSQEIKDMVAQNIKTDMRRHGKIIITTTPNGGEDGSFEFYKQWWQQKEK